MTIASEISRLQCAKADICTAIENKWVTVWDITIDNYSECIDAISWWWWDYFIDYTLVWWWGGWTANVVYNWCCACVYAWTWWWWWEVSLWCCCPQSWILSVNIWHWWAWWLGWTMRWGDWWASSIWDVIAKWWTWWKIYCRNDAWWWVSWAWCVWWAYWSQYCGASWWWAGWCWSGVTNMKWWIWWAWLCWYWGWWNWWWNQRQATTCDWWWEWWWNCSTITCIMWHNATNCWGWWWGAWLYNSTNSHGWWNWADWLAIICYPIDGSYWFSDAMWWDCVVTEWWYKKHYFNTTWYFSPCWFWNEVYCIKYIVVWWWEWWAICWCPWWNAWAVCPWKVLTKWTQFNIVIWAWWSWGSKYSWVGIWWDSSLIWDDIAIIALWWKQTSSWSWYARYCKCGFSSNWWNWAAWYWWYALDSWRWWNWWLWCCWMGWWWWSWWSCGEYTTLWCCWWWNWWNLSWCPATTYWSWWWGGYCCKCYWWSWCQWVADICYPIDGSYWFSDAIWWNSCYVCDWYCVHRFTSNGTFSIINEQMISSLVLKSYEQIIAMDYDAAYNELNLHPAEYNYVLKQWWHSYYETRLPGGVITIDNWTCYAYDWVSGWWYNTGEPTSGGIAFKILYFNNWIWNKKEQQNQTIIK